MYKSYWLIFFEYIWYVQAKLVLMRLVFTFLIFLLINVFTFAQSLKIKPRKEKSLVGSEFAKLISDSTLSLNDREYLIFEEIKNGNIPDFLSGLCTVEQEQIIGNKTHKIHFFVLPDYMAIGSNTDYFYVPMTPILAQKVAKHLNCSLPTKKMVDLIYHQSTIKLAPSPLPPNKAMTTVPIFIKHSNIIQQQLSPYLATHKLGELTAGNKKDIIISNKIYTEKTAKVVIYGWHQLNGKAIQPVYNKHTNTWADYSHGVRLVLNKVLLNGKKTTLKKILSDSILNSLLSDEGKIDKPYYPLTAYK